MEETVETIAETIADAISEVTEAAPTIDYTEYLESIKQSCSNLEYATQLLCGFLLFFVIVCLCYFSYRFFKMFF